MVVAAKRIAENQDDSLGRVGPGGVRQRRSATAHRWSPPKSKSTGRVRVHGKDKRDLLARVIAEIYGCRHPLMGLGNRALLQ